MSSDLSFDARDEFKRKKIAENIIKLLKPEANLSPFIIDGEWGTGKTEFSLKLKDLISKQESDTKVIYVDAFKGDHSDSPLLLIIAAIAKILPEGEEKTSFIKKAIPALRLTIKTAGKAGFAWLLKKDFDQFGEEVSDAVKTIGDSAIDSTINSLLKDYIDEEKNITFLKKCLKDIAKENKIVIIIDELDRCKPSFSTSILETIKHIFDVENVFFILVTNLTQLQASINHIYGSSVDSQKYLDKFIKYTIKLPITCNISGFRSSKVSTEYWDYISKTDLSIISDSDKEKIKDLIEVKNLTLRDIEKLSRGLHIYNLISDGLLNHQNGRINSDRIIYFISIYLCCFYDSSEIIKGISSDLPKYLSDVFNVNSNDISNRVSTISNVIYSISNNGSLNNLTKRTMLSIVNTMLFIDI